MNLSAWTSRTETPGIVAVGLVVFGGGSVRLLSMSISSRTFESAAASAERSASFRIAEISGPRASPSTFAIGSIAYSVCSIAAAGDRSSFVSLDCSRALPRHRHDISTSSPKRVVSPPQNAQRASLKRAFEHG